MSVFNAMNISASGLSAERLRMDVISANIANANTTRTEEGGPYRRKVAVFEEQYQTSLNSQSLTASGVIATNIIEDETEFNREYNPTHPDADEDGYVLTPNVDTTSEMLDLMVATRAYESNVTVMNAAKAMYSKALEIGK